MEIIILLIVLFLDLVLCKLVADAWHNRGLSSRSGFWISFFFTPLIGILLGLLHGARMNSLFTIKCPTCAELVKMEAKICRFCGHQLNVDQATFQQQGITFTAEDFLQAVQEGNKEVVELIINNGANINTRDEYGRTALMLAAKKGHTDIVKTLILSGADVNLMSYAGWTALKHAKNNSGIIALLRMSGAK